MKKILTFWAILIPFSIFANACVFNNENKSFTPETLDEKLDENTIIDAVETMDIALCSTIKNEEQKVYCEKKVNDQILMSQAEMEVNIDKCSRIIDEDTKARCEILVNTQLSNQEMDAKLKEEQDKLAEIEKEGNVEKCQEIEDLGLKNQCETNIYLKKARDLKDPQYCDKIMDEGLQEMCKAQLVTTEPVN